MLKGNTLIELLRKLVSATTAKQRNLLQGCLCYK